MEETKKENTPSEEGPIETPEIPAVSSEEPPKETPEEVPEAAVKEAE